MSAKHIKTKRNPKLEHKYLGPCEILEAVGKQAYKLKLPAKWRIHPAFHVSLLERDVTRREAVDQKIADQLRFEEGEQPEQEVDSIMDSMVFAEEAVDGRPPWLYYLIHWKGETHAEAYWELIDGSLICDGYSRNITPKTQTNPLPPFRLWIKALHHLQWQRDPAQKSPFPSLYANVLLRGIPSQCATARQNP